MLMSKPHGLLLGVFRGISLTDKKSLFGIRAGERAFSLPLYFDDSIRFETTYYPMVIRLSA
jgi:hypothetical protein